MTRFDHRSTRRRILGTGAALTGSFFLPDDALSAPDTGRRFSRAAAQGRQFEGQIVIAIKQNPADVAKQAVAEAYQAEQPGVELVWETQEIEPADYVSLLGTQLGAGDPRFDLVSANYLSTYDGYVNFDRYKSTVNQYTDRPWEEDFEFSAVSRNSAGQRNVLNTREAGLGWFYNKDLFAQTGVEPPTTWSEFVEVCATLQEAGITPIVSNYQWMVPQWLNEIYWDQYNLPWIKIFRAQPGDWNYNPEIDGSFVYDPVIDDIHNTFTPNMQRFWRAIREGEIRVDTPEAAAIARNFAAVFPQYATDDFYVIGDPYPTFLQQEAAMMVNGTWMLNIINADMESLSPERLAELGIESSDVNTFEWDVFPILPMEGELIKSPVRSVEGGTGEYISAVRKSQEHTDMIMDFVKFWVSPAGYEPYHDAAIESEGYSPAGPSLVRGIEEPPEIQALFELVPLLGNAEYDYYQVWANSLEGNTISQQDLRGLFKQVLDEEITPEAYSQQLQQYFTDNLESFLELAGLTQADLDNPARQPGT